jgi:glutamine synthetase
MNGTALDCQKAEMYLTNSGLADTAYFGAEAEFFIFDNICFDQNPASGFYYIDAEEALELVPQGR